jgi:UDP-2,3-diacylglucosamine hydrolase
MTDSIGIIAGNGDYPLLVAKGARSSGVRKIVTAALVGETKKEMEELSDVVCWIEIGQLGKLISFFKKNDITQVIMAGQVTPVRLFGRLKLDLRMVKVLAKIAMRGAEPIFSTMADELQKDGISLIDSSLFMKDQMADPGLMTKGRMKQSFSSDITFGASIARSIADIDIGQTIVVKDRAVVAVEAIEGTDATIQRAGALAGKDTVVIKLSKRKQDMRFDLPVVGMKTLETMKESEAKVLAVDAGKTIMLGKKDFISLADELGIHVYGIGENENS